MNENTPWFTSSWDPTQLSLTIKGLLVGYIPILLVVAEKLGYVVNDATAYNWVNDASLYIACGMILFGLIRRFLITFGFIKPKAVLVQPAVVAPVDPDSQLG